jgi:ketosteroid isomerase-like protein
MAADDFARRLRDVTNAHDLEGIVGCFRDDYTLTAPCHPSRDFVGTEQVRRNWGALFTAVPDLCVDVIATHVDGDTVWSEWEMRGRRHDGAVHLMRGVIVFEVLEGRAAAARFFLEPVDADTTTADEAISRLAGETP